MLVVGVAIGIVFSVSIIVDALLHKRRKERAHLRVIQGGRK